MSYKRRASSLHGALAAKRVERAETACKVCYCNILWEGYLAIHFQVLFVYHSYSVRVSVTRHCEYVRLCATLELKMCTCNVHV